MVFFDEDPALKPHPRIFADSVANIEPVLRRFVNFLSFLWFVYG
jgi:hypothetical protein